MDKTITNKKVQEMQRIYDVTKKYRERTISNIYKFACLINVDSVDVYRRCITTDSDLCIETKLSKHLTTDQDYKYFSRHKIFGKYIDCYCNELL